MVQRYRFIGTPGGILDSHFDSPLLTISLTAGDVHWRLSSGKSSGRLIDTDIPGNTLNGVYVLVVNCIDDKDVSCDEVSGVLSGGAWT